MPLLRHVRLPIQLLLLVVAAAIVLHGLFGPQIAPRNMATVLTWVHYRGLLIIGLLAIGNVFCMGCPMVLVRDAGRRIAHPALRWPRMLRTKWIAVVLFIAVLFAYELFDLWALPRATAWLVIAYFGLALMVDVLFAGASFCKYVCPVGQFNFIASTMSPAELHVRDIGTCRSCQTADCIKGTWGPPRAEGQPLTLVRRGCELGLFLPSKVGNLDCTLCLDCVGACPHENIALTWRVPGEELLETRRRSGIGVLARRWDFAALAVTFTFGALLNAFAMTAPVHAAERWIADTIGSHSDTPILAIVFAVGLIGLPIGLLGGAATLSRVITGDYRSPARIAVRFAYALIPFGCGVWLAHYGFHLLTGVLTIVPVAQAAAIDATGWSALGDPLWRWAGLTPGTMFPIQLGCMLLGSVGSLVLMYRTSEHDYPARPASAAAPWTAVLVILTVAAIWIVAQPMDMRGLGSMR